VAVANSFRGFSLMNSPYVDISPNNWLPITQELVKRHPPSTDEIVDIILTSWQSIFDSKLGTKGFRIGQDIFPKPQIMGFLLHELIPLELKAKYPDEWRGDASVTDKDIEFQNLKKFFLTQTKLFQ
jgi:ScaI restriction endonuclease